jgi:hypothetical protein
MTKSNKLTNKSTSSNSVPANVNIGDSGNGPMKDDKFTRLIETMSFSNTSIQSFEGTEGIDVRSWLEQFVYLEDDWSGEKLLAFVKQFLTGKAKKWMNAMEDIEFHDFSSFKESIIKEFDEEEDANRNEIKEFYKILLNGPQKGEFPEFILDLIIQNKKANIEFEVIRKDIEELFPLIVRDKVSLAEDWSEIRSIIKRHPSLFKQNKAQNSKKMTPQEKDTQKSLSKNNNSKKPKCDHCGGSHPSSRCYKWLNSQKKTQSDQGTTTKVQEDKEEKTVKTIKGNKNDLVYVVGFLNKRKVNVLLDTGASHSFVDKSLIDSSELEGMKREQVVTANGKCFTFGEVESDLLIEGKVYNVSLQIMCPLSEDVILGRDFLSYNKVHIDFNSCKVICNGESWSSMTRLKDCNCLDLKKLRSELPDQLVDHRECDTSIELVKDYFKRLEEKGENLKNAFGIEHKITLKPDVSIANVRVYHMNVKKKEFLKQECLDLARVGILEESMSRWNAPTILVPKRTGGFRLALDYRQLNDRTIKEVCQPPTIEECLNSLSGARWFSQLDLERGYYQVPMAKESKELTAFMTPIGKFQFRKMPFGLTNAPATFQCLMYKVFRDLINTKVCVYMDDITIYSRTEEEHHRDLAEVLQVLLDNGLKLGKEKSVFCTQRVDLLGFSVKNGKVFPDEKRLGPFQDKLRISTIKQLHSFVGSLGYFRNFIPDYSKKTFELNKVINRKKKLEEVDVDGIVENLRVELINSAFLGLPDMNIPFIIESDASDYCIGAVLKQKIDGKEVCIRFCSRNLISAEINYPTLEKEALAVIYAIKTFQNYLHLKFTVRTDHKSLIWLYKVKNPQGRIARWLMFLAGMDFTIEYKEGQSNVVADCLSRIQVFKLSKEDDIKEAVLEAHSVTGHSGVNNTFNFLKIHREELKITKEQVKDLVKVCEVCLKFKRNRAFKQFPTKLDGSFVEIGIDCIGPLPKSSSGNRFIVLATDYFTKWVEGKALKRKSAEEIARFLVEEVFSRHGPVKVIRSDQGLEFTNKLVNSVAELWGSRFRHSSPYHPQSNGLAERTNRTVVEKMSKAMTEYSQNWDKVLPYVLMQYRVSIIERFNASPFMLLYGRTPQIPSTLLSLPSDFDLYFVDPIEYVREKLSRMKERDELVEDVSKKEEERVMKKNLGRADPEDLDIGDLVLLKKHDSLKRKFESPYEDEQYEVVMKKGQGAYQIRNCDGGRTFNINRKDLVKVTETEKVLLYLIKERMLPSAETVPSDMAQSGFTDLKHNL